jgi:hypothetical protein
MHGRPWEIFTNPTNVQQLYVHISYKEIPPNRTIKVGSTNKNPFTRQDKKKFTAPIFTNLTITQQIVEGITFTELYPNQK